MAAEEETPVEPLKDILEDSKASAGEVQTYWNNIDRSILPSDPLLSLFKPSEIDATMAQCLSGAYHSYWSMEKISDLQNTVDSAPNCPEKLKQIFAPGNTRNARIRANRIGQIIFDGVKHLKESGAGGDHSAPATRAEMSQPPSAAQPTPTAPSQRLLTGHHLVQYMFASDLPPEAQLRVRDAPSMNGAVVGTVSKEDVIMGSSAVSSGDYVRVQIRGWPEEAWMLTSMGGQALLVPSGAEPAPAPAAPPPSMAAPTPAATQFFAPPPAASPAPTARPMSSGQPMMSQSMRTSMMDPMMASQMMNMSMMQQPDMMGASLTGMEGQSVPYELYRRLEMRVNRLEQELNNLKMCLRSI